MYQQQQSQQQPSIQTLLPDQDMAYAVLADLKRVVREYATAATESSCPQIRQMFTQLMNDTLRMQGDLYNVMQQQNMYSKASPALRQEVDKQLRQQQQMQQKEQQHLQQIGLAGQPMQQQFQAYQQPQSPQYQQSQQYQQYQQYQYRPQ
ncbi:spore coat protein [Paenibacillus spongiae]|uniref:Spore coat protein n=1 Tax=Paenibacillus spongiae TaxID=2909671 RepID=A0ABY5S468_9BACL|nr:spore coat protein [Paenibacillus spongiae]UVI28701.1 spore coat protein [Paenibacillus spongiae]